MTTRRSRARRFWIVSLLLYLAVMTAVVLLLLETRNKQIARLSKPRAQDAWQDWRSAAAQQAGTKGPVQRRRPQSVEPPALVLLRDYFGVVLAATVVFGTALLAVMILAVHGVLAGTDLADQQGKGQRTEEDQ